MKYLKLFEESKHDSEILELIEKYWDIIDPFQLKDVINGEIEDFGIKKMTFLFEKENRFNDYYVEITDNNIEWVHGGGLSNLDKFPGSIDVAKKYYFEPLVKIDENTPRTIRLVTPTNKVTWARKPRIMAPKLIGVTREFHAIPNINDDVFLGWEIFIPEIVLSIPDSSEFHQTISDKYEEYNSILKKIGIPYHMTTSNSWRDHDNLICYTLYHV